MSQEAFFGMDTRPCCTFSSMLSMPRRMSSAAMHTWVPAASAIRKEKAPQLAPQIRRWQQNRDRPQTLVRQRDLDRLERCCCHARLGTRRRGVFYNHR